MSVAQASVSSIETNEAPNPMRWRAMAVLALVQFMLALDTTVVNVALPSIQKDLGFNSHDLAWVVNAYTLTAGGFLILGGRAADYFGRKRLFFIGVVLFALASATSGAAQSSGMLVGSRFVQGLGEAIAAPASLSMVVLLFADPAERAKAIGVWGGITIMGATLGVVLSGAIVSAISWRWIFFVNLPVALFALTTVGRMIPESRIAKRTRIDWLGAVLITGGLTALVDGFLSASNHGWGSTAVLLPLLIGAALLTVFGIYQGVAKDPLVPLRFFRNRTRVVANLGTMLFVAGFLSMFFVMTLYMQNVLHYSPLKSGLVYLPYGLMILVGVAVTVQVLPRIGVKIGLVFAYLCCAGGLFWMSHIGATSSLGHFLPGMLLMAFGNGIAFPALQNAAVSGLGQADAGLGSAVQQTSQQVGGSIGLAVLVTVALRHAASQVATGTAPAIASTDGYSLALKIAAGVMILAAILSATALERVKFVPPDQLAVGLAEASAGVSTDEPAVPRPVPAAT